MSRTVPTIGNQPLGGFPYYVSFFQGYLPSIGLMCGWVDGQVTRKQCIQSALMWQSDESDRTGRGYCVQLVNDDIT